MACAGHAPAQSKSVGRDEAGNPTQGPLLFFKEVASMKRTQILWPGSFRNIGRLGFDVSLVGSAGPSTT